MRFETVFDDVERFLAFTISDAGSQTRRSDNPERQVHLHRRAIHGDATLHGTTNPLRQQTPL
jgi:hypothetical protein